MEHSQENGELSGMKMSRRGFMHGAADDATPAGLHRKLAAYAGICGPHERMTHVQQT